MKKLLFISTILFLALTSCKKQEIKTVEQEQEEAGQVDEEIRLYGKWVLVSGVMFVENLETGEKTSYDHFDDTKKSSSLRYSGPEFDFETIVQDSTTWSFYQPEYVPGYGEFVLNNDTVNPFGFYVTKSDWSITEHPQATGMDDMHLGGSSRPLEAYTEDYGEEIVMFYVQESYESIDGYNCKYFSELKFKKIEEW